MRDAAASRASHRIMTLLSDSLMEMAPGLKTTFGKLWNPQILTFRDSMLSVRARKTKAPRPGLLPVLNGPEVIVGFPDKQLQ